MRKVSIVSERNEENNTYEIKTIVIFDENSAPRIINYDGVQDLLAVVSFAEKNGCDILGNEGIKPALESGLLQVISKSNEKKMAELKAEILQEQLKYAPKEEKTEQQQMEETVQKKVDELKGQKSEDPQVPTNETVKKEEPKKKRKLDIPEEFRNLAEYLKIDKFYPDEMIQSLEKARENVIIAKYELNAIEDKESVEAKLARRNLKDRQAEYEKLHARYRAQLAEAIKNAKATGEALPKEYRDLAKYFRLDMLRTSLSSEGHLDERIVGLERAKDNIILAKHKLSLIKDENSPEAKLARIELKDREAEYEKLRARYRAELAEAVKNAEQVQTKKMLNLSEDDREFAEYLKLNILRAKNNYNLKPEEAARIEELKAKNERVAALEKARENVYKAKDIEKTIEDPASPAAILARREVKDREEEYRKLHELYRGQLAEAIKKAQLVEVEKGKSLVKTNKEVTRVPDNSAVERTTPAPVPTPTNETEVRRDETVPRDNTNKNEGQKEIDRTTTIVPTPTEEKTNKDDHTPRPVDPEFRREVVRPVSVTQDDKNKKQEPVAHLTSGKQDDKQTETTTQEKNKSSVPVPAPVPFPTRKKVTREAEKKDEDKTKTQAPVDNGTEQKKDAPVVTPSSTSTSDDKNNTSDKNKASDKNNGKNNNAVLVKDTETKKAKGVDPKPDQQVDVQIKDNNGKTQTVKVKKTSKLKKFFKGLLGVVVGIASVVGTITGITWLIDRHNAKKQQVQQPITPPIVTEKPAETTTNNIVNTTIVSPILESYFKQYNVPQGTRAFFQRPEVQEFLSQYKNEDQLKEVVSALAYGYEANLLTTKEGNFRIAKDGQNILTSFTHDFLCAKAVVNRYSSAQMMNVFGGSNISYEELMNGFKNYCYTITTYGMTATEPLPFQYLTNGNSTSTQVLNELQEKLIVVNSNRANGTLTSEHTDDFIATVFKTYVQNDGSLNMSEGAKTVGAALVESYVAMQSQVSNGEALYLHQDRGYAKAGINLMDVDGHFTFEYPDKTHYEFTSLYDVMNHGYGDVNETAARCLSQQNELLSSIQHMHTLSNSSEETARRELANALYQNNMSVYGNMVTSGEISEELFTRILSINPMMSDEIEAYRRATNSNEKEYVGFEQTVQGADGLLGIQNRQTNNYADLINNRRDLVYLNNNYKVLNGKRYTEEQQVIQQQVVQQQGDATQKAQHASQQDTQERQVVSVVQTQTHEQVKKEDLTQAEQEEAQRQIQQQQQQEQQAQQQSVEKTKQEIHEAVEQGASLEEVQQIAQEGGVVLSEEFEHALEEKAQGEQKQHQIDSEVEQHTTDAEREAAARKAKEEQEQAEALARQQELIRQSMEAEQAEQEVLGTEGQTAEQPTQEQQQEHQGGAIDQTDPDRVDTEAGEEPYVASSANVRDELEALRAAALEIGVDEDDLDIGGPTLG